MKARSLKLRDAHKASVASVCSIIWGGGGNHLITASDSELTVLVHEFPLQSGKQPKTIRHHKDGVTCLALSPDSKCLASASIDHSVKLQSFPDGEFQNNITRFTLPTRAVAFNKSGSLLATAGDDDGIKLIATADGSVSRVLKGHKGPVTCLAFDPNNLYLASVDGMGTVMYWELSSGKPEHILNNVAPNRMSESSIYNVICWSPDGETLAVSGLKNDVVMYDRDTSEKIFSLKGEHERSICFMSWSPNGKYMATSSLDMQVLVWDVDMRQDIERLKFDDKICSLAWKPNGNALALIDVMGRFGVWESPVPSGMKSPFDGAPLINERKVNDLFIDDDDEHQANASGSLDKVGEDSYGESAPINRKRPRKQPKIEEDLLDESSDKDEDLLHQLVSHKRQQKHKKGGSGTGESDSSSRTRVPNIQEAFQPCSTPAQAGKRHFLCYNMLGSITTIENEEYSHIEVDFHDTSRGPRVPSMTDYFGFTVATLGETGCAFANPANGEKTPSTFMYRPFNSWANNSEWSMRFDSEEVKVVALGNGWAAAITDCNFVRIFSEGGLQRHVFSLGGPVVTAAGNKDELAIVLHTSGCLPSGDQMLEVKVFNVTNASMPVSTHLPLTPGSSLSWLGFSEESMLCSYDTKGVLRAYKNQFGGCWVPLFSADKVRQSEDENYWVVGLSQSKLFCIVCKAPECYPQVTPKPVLTLLNLSIPLASSDLGATDLESELVMVNLNLSKLQEKIEQLAAAGQDSTSIDDEAFDLETARDRCILRLIANCCNGDKLVRATELAKLLSLDKSIKGAIKLVTALKLPILAEKFSAILEERSSIENAETLSNGVKPSNQIRKHELGLQEPSQVVSMRSNVISVVPKNDAPHDGNQDKAQSTINLGEKKLEIAGAPAQEKKALSHSAKKEKADITNKLTERMESGSKTKLNAKKVDHTPDTTTEVKKTGVTNHQPARPSNPFAKLSSNQEKTSLLDSLKKMAKTDVEKKENKTKK